MKLLDLIGAVEFADVVLEPGGGGDDERGVAVGIEPSPKSAPGAVVAGKF